MRVLKERQDKSAILSKKVRENTSNTKKLDIKYRDDDVQDSTDAAGCSLPKQRIERFGLQH